MTSATHLLGLLVGPLDDRPGAAPGIAHQLPGRAARLLQHRGGLPTELLERRCALLEAGDFALQLGPCPLGLGVLAQRRRQARGQLGKGGVDPLAVIPAADHPERRRSLGGGPSGLRVWLVPAHGTLRARRIEPVAWSAEAARSHLRRLRRKSSQHSQPRVNIQAKRLPPIRIPR